MTATRGQALAFARAQVAHTQLPASLRAQGFTSWENLCLGFVRSAWDVRPMFGSAFAAWMGADPADRHPGGRPEDAPVGAALCFKGSNPAGHIDLAAWPFRNGVAAAFSNDLVRLGHIDKVRRDAPVTHWGQRYLGWLSAVNDVDLPLGGHPTAKAKPKQTKRYAALATAMKNIETSLGTAKREHDAADVKLLEDEYQRLHGLWVRLRRS